ncbi:hypothetical protein MLD38_040460 [Melastoma candidum]|nr:hypothetical protein MLD38_040460 [Melastoma candidum]
MLWAMDESRAETVLAAQDREDWNRGKICKLEDKVDRLEKELAALKGEAPPQKARIRLTARKRALFVPRYQLAPKIRVVEKEVAPAQADPPVIIISMMKKKNPSANNSKIEWVAIKDEEDEPNEPSIDLLCSEELDTTNPVEAGDWLHAIEKKLDLLQCTDQEKTHIPSGVVSLKKKEFRSLTQGSRSVSGVSARVQIVLPRYAPEDVRNDEERQEKFLEGLNDELSYPLMTGDYPDFQKLVDKAIRQEDKYNRMEQKKRRIAHIQGTTGNNQKPRLTLGPQSMPQGGSFVCCSSAKRQFFNNNAGNNIRNQAPRPVAAPTATNLPRGSKAASPWCVSTVETQDIMLTSVRSPDA